MLANTIIGPKQAFDLGVALAAYHNDTSEYFASIR